MTHPSISDLTTDQLLKLLEIIKQVDGSSVGDAIKFHAFEELKKRIGFTPLPIPERTTSESNIFI